MPSYAPIGVERAHLTLRDGARFLGAAHAIPRRDGRARRYRARLLGNGLRELDLFLGVLIDEVGHAQGWAAPELRALRQLRHTADKLIFASTRMALVPDGAGRLRALKRCGNILYHCDGRVRSGDTRGAERLTLGWPSGAREGGAAASLRIGDRLVVSDAELLWVCRFYAAQGDALAHSQSPAR